jgi:hypothetical protein
MLLTITDLLYYSLKDLFHNRGRMLLSVVGMAVVILSYLMLDALAQTLSDFISMDAVSRNLIVTQSDTIDPTDSTLDAAALQAAQDLVPELASRVSPLIVRHMRIGGQLVQLLAPPLDDWGSVYQMDLVDGRWPGMTGEVAVAQAASRSNGWSIGSILNIYGSDFRVTGVIHYPGAAFAAIWMPLETAQALFGDKQAYQVLYVQVKTGQDAGEVRAMLQADPRLAQRYAVYFEDNYTHSNTQSLKDITSLVKVISLIALLAVTLGTYNASSLSLAERGREIAILSMIGFSTPTVRWVLVVRALAQGFLAYGVGLLAAYGIAMLYHQSGDLSIFGIALSFDVTLAGASVGLVWTEALALTGAWLSTRSLLTFQTAEALRS